MDVLLILVVPLLLLWLLVLRPAQKRQRQAAELRQALQPGQDIVTVSGMLGTVTEVTDEDVSVSVAPGVEVRMLKGAVGQVRPAPAPGREEEAPVPDPDRSEEPGGDSPASDPGEPGDPTGSSPDRPA